MRGPIALVGEADRERALAFQQAVSDPGALPVAARLVATPYAWVPPDLVPRRAWIFRKHFARGFLSATVGAGGGGKTNIDLKDAISMVVGRDLDSGESIQEGPFRVWFMQLEDPLEEMQRRIQAICLHYDLTETDFDGRLYVDSGRDRPIVVAREIQGIVMAVPEDVGAIKSEIQERAIDVLIIDPFVASHQVGENDNMKQDAVARIWKEIASECNVSIEAVHHVRKANGMEVGIDDVRGAGAFVNAARSVRLLNVMSPAEATTFGIDEERRRFYIWLNPHAKSNMAPPSSRREWYESRSVALGNGDDDHDGDHIGVAVRWMPPDAMEGVTAGDVARLRGLLAPMTEDEVRALCRAHPNANGWIGKLVGELLDIDVSLARGKQQVASIVKEWARCHVLKEDYFADEKGNHRPFFRLGSGA